MSVRNRSGIVAAAACLLFFFAAQAFVPLLGVENDEALFGMAFFPPKYAVSVKVGHSTLPLMLMTYVGTLKAWLYRPLFKFVHPQVWSLREPMVLAGVLSIALFYLLLRRISGERAAVIGAVLLATDAPYLLTTVFDWGPVALQHLLFTGGALCLVRFYQDRSNGALAGGAFLFGLAMWDKALATWLLSGLAIGGVLFLWREVRSVITVKRVGIAAAAFLLGSLPLWTYNVENHWPTFGGNFHRDTSEMKGKLKVLGWTFDGQGLFGYLTDEDWQTPHPHTPPRLVTPLNVRQGVGLYVFLLALLAVPFAGGNGRKAILLALVAMIVAWVQMAITANAGGSVHHTILLWPLPYLIVAISLSEACRRLGRAQIPVLATIVALAAVSNLLVTATYYNKMARNGGSQSWTDAIFPLNDFLRSAPASTVYTMDWGILDNLRLLSAGKIPLSPSDTRPEVIAAITSDPANVYVAHTKEMQVFPDNPNFLKLAASAGYRPHTLAVISDSFGRKVFDVYRLERVSEQP